MASQSRFSKLFDYDLWANRTVLKALENHTSNHTSFEHRKRALEFLYHIIGTQHHWFRRVTAADLPNTEIWPEFLLADCKTLIIANHQRWVELIENEHDDLNQPISYTNSKGVEFESKLSDILQHIIIHGQHHRSQIALLMRMSDVAPPATDYIFYTRQQ